MVAAGGVLLSARLLGWPGRSLAVHRGPFGDLPSALDALYELAQSEGAWCLEVMPDASFDDALKEAFSARNWQAVGPDRYTLRLDLTPDKDALLAGFESRARYQVRRGEREGTIVRPARNQDDVANFCRLMSERDAEKSLAGTSYTHYSVVGNYLLANPSRGVVLLAERQGEVLGANLLWRSAFRVEYLYGTSRKQKVSVGYPLQWASIMWAKDIGATEYDFGGYNPNRNGGPALMKRAFCRNVVNLSPRWRRVSRPTFFTFAQKLRGWIKR